MTDRIDLDPSDGPWLNSVLQRVFAARREGDEAEVERLLDYARAEGGQELGDLAQQLAAADTARARALVQGREMKPFGISLAPKGELLCDFCAGPDPIVYYSVTEFEIVAPGGSWLSGDRFYACAACRRFVDTSDWKGLRAWIGPKQWDPVHALIFNGFRQHRTGDVVEFEPGTNPEKDRT